MHREKEEHHGDKKHGKHNWHHLRHHKGFKSIVKRESKDVLVPEVLLEVANINEGDFLEISIRKIKKYQEEE